jgi:hypothetical protein
VAELSLPAVLQAVKAASTPNAKAIRMVRP